MTGYVLLDDSDYHPHAGLRPLNRRGRPRSREHQRRLVAPADEIIAWLTERGVQLHPTTCGPRWQIELDPRLDLEFRMRWY